MKRIIGLLFFIFIIACSSINNQSSYETNLPLQTPVINECDPNLINQYAKEVHMKLQRFFDRVSILEVSNDFLIDGILQLNDIRTEVMFIERPNCTKNAQEIIIRYMNKTIEYYLHNLSKTTKTTVITTKSIEELLNSLKRGTEDYWDYWLRRPIVFFQITKNEFNQQINLLLE